LTPEQIKRLLEDVLDTKVLEASVAGGVVRVKLDLPVDAALEPSKVEDARDAIPGFHLEFEW